ncbi:Com family DNA-binding transcriptional regulator [Alysiella crassa]|uniref:Mu-like prophage protein Com n=1 Tax=Alysiella crassa TaxID=153491 RepID=A0A376BTM3_9NEIS|nr:Com family DNA-binding transcriptional regulator [Alysiella crassa]UOP05857.1 Com family DNA-binding transcriptional regulator [Alysiella crassa]SSY80286.1 Mu-like prophage protein Com [Alysiella crassa]
MYRELRCQNCNKKLANAAGVFEISIKCARCKSLNFFKQA